MRKQFRTIARAISLLALFGLLVIRTAAQQPPAKFRLITNGVPDRYVVVLRDAAAGPLGATSRAPQLARDVATLYGGRLLLTYRHALNGFAVELPEAAARALSEDPRVEYVIQDGRVTAVDTEYNPPSWGLDRVDQRYEPLDSAYSYNANGSGVNVYILDTGISAGHPDFGGRASAVADFVGDGQNGNDCYGHGTHVAGTIGGSAFGVAKNVRLYAVRVLDCQGSGLNSEVIAGIDWVTAYHASPSVANMSLGGPTYDPLDSAVRNSIASGVVYSIAAGNHNDDASNYSPSRVGEAITVGATTINDVRASFSNYGSVLDLFAPGDGVNSTWPAGLPAIPGCSLTSSDSAVCSGTSMATPHVAGVAAMYLQLNPGASPAAVRDAIVNEATASIVGSPGPGSPNLLLFSAFISGSDSTILNAGAVLYPEQSAASPSGEFVLKYQNDGNLVLYDNGAAVWAINCWPQCSDTGFNGNTFTPAGWATMQADGNFVVYNAYGLPVWHTWTFNNPGAYLAIKNDGNLVVYSSTGSILWQR